MKEVFEAVESRIKSPYFGYAVIAFFALNWQGVFLLLVSDGTAIERIAEFEKETSTLTLLVLPLIVAALVAASTHWVKYIFERVSSKPLELIAELSLEAEHKRTIKQTELEQSRAKLFEVKEQEIIDRAKRDEAIAELDDESKKKVEAEIEQLRKTRDQLSVEVKNFHPPSEITQEYIEARQKFTYEEFELLNAAVKDGDGTIIKLRTLGGSSIQVGKVIFGDKDKKEFAKYEAALESLVNRGLVKSRGNKNELFELTDNGWRAVNAL